MFTIRASLALVALALAAASSAQLITNGNFETDAYPTNGVVQLSKLTGWSILSTGDIAGCGAGYFGQTSQEIDLSGFGDGAGSGIFQTFATVPNAKYTLSLDVFTGTNVGSVKVMVGSDVLSPGLAGTVLTNSTFTFTAASQSTTLTLTNTGGSVSQVDNVSVTPVNPAPEPSALAALGLGAMAVLRRRKR